jgi:peptidoglycan hydrolase-like protein with peptidoglycan-binding domain
VVQPARSSVPIARRQVSDGGCISGAPRGLDALLARSVATRAQQRLLQRFRVKAHLDSPDLDDDRLQQAVSSADLALNVNVDSGEAVLKFQKALTKAGFPNPESGKFDSETQGANARFQTREGIPYPTGRQAGPKTLSALDDVLLKGAKPDPKPEPKPKPLPQPPKDCARYEPGERELSLRTPGAVARTGGFGQILTLSNFGAGKSQMKAAHEEALRTFVREFDLADPASEMEIDFIRGFTDSVDAEEKNAALREARAVDVQFMLKKFAVPAAPDGQAADLKSYDTGCTPPARSLARRVIVALRRKVTPPPTCMPLTLGPGRTGCGTGTDFTHNDSPSVSTASAAKMAAWAVTEVGNPFRSNVPNVMCEADMDAELTLLGGSAGHAAFARFRAGTGGTEVLTSSTTLGAMALKSRSFAVSVAAVKREIELQLAAQANSGARVLDPCLLKVAAVPETHFPKLGPDPAALQAVIGGTHGEKLFLTTFSGDLAHRSYSANLRFVICDNFGVDEADLYSPGLIGFWVLQHERSPTKYKPYINELDLSVTISGTF